VEREAERGPALSVASRNKLRIGLAGLSALFALPLVHAEANRRLDLRENWALQNSCKVGASGEVVSTAQFAPEHWYKATIPSTVMAAQVSHRDQVRVRIKNPSSQLAFQIRLALVDAESGDEILPVLWEDNYLSLLPGESRTLVAHYDSPLGAEALKLDVSGWNIEAAAALVASAGAGARH